MYREEIFSCDAKDSIEENSDIDLKSSEWSFSVSLKRKGDKYEVKSNVELYDSISCLLSKAETILKIRFFSQKEDVPDVEKSLKWLESFESQEEHEFEKFEIDASSFVANEMIHFKTSVSIDNLRGNHLPGIDFSQPTNHSDVVLVVEGKKLHVNKAYLAMYSKYFDTLFFSNFKEATQEEIVLEGLIYHQFHDLLQQLYPGSRRIKKHNLDYLLTLADRFNIPQVLHHCEQYLISTNNVTYILKVQYADKYNLNELFGAIAKELYVRRDDVYRIKNSPFYEGLKPESKEIVAKETLRFR